MSGPAWYWSRTAFKRDAELLDTVRQVDAELKWRCDQQGRVEIPEAVYTFPRTDFGRVSWDMSYERYQPIGWNYVAADRFPDRGLKDGHLIAASNMAVPQIPEGAIPLHIVDQLDIASIDEVDDGFELFGGLDHQTSIYFVEGAFSGLIKIGIASHLESRISSIQTASQEPVSMIHHLPGNKRLEKFLHGLFEPLRHHGEWFYPHWTLHSVIMGLSG